jgi:hypothetical protein
VVSEATAQGDVAALNYLVADKYVRALQAFAQAPNQKVMIVPMELASLAGTVAGIAQIATAALGEGVAAAGTARASARSGVVPDTPLPPPQANGEARQG